MSNMEERRRSAYSTKEAQLTGTLLGTVRRGPVAFSHVEFYRLAEYYGFDIKACQSNALEFAGSTRNMFRLVERDGLRVMGLLSEYLEDGQDPVSLVIDALRWLDSMCHTHPGAMAEETTNE